MTQFIQLHLLTSYAPSNLNRDELGRPKTAIFGNTQRLRVSSQSLKRAWRTSPIFLGKLGGAAEFVDEHHEPRAAGASVGLRTKDIGNYVFEKAHAKLGEGKANELAKKIAEQFAKLDAEDSKKPGQGRQTKQLVHLSIEEKAAIDVLVARLTKDAKLDDKEIADLVKSGKGTPDIALFGRMLADKPQANVEAACQVAHALSVHTVTVDDDYFSAVDDLNKGLEDKGAGHIGTTEFAAAVFYLYICIDRDQLLANLHGNQEACDTTLAALVEACCKVSPRGKQNSHASRERAHYVLVERGQSQPRSLSVAFLKPIEGQDVLRSAIAKIETTRERMEKAYGDATEARKLDVLRGDDTAKTAGSLAAVGTLAELVSFAAPSAKGRK